MVGNRTPFLISHSSVFSATSFSNLSFRSLFSCAYNFVSLASLRVSRVSFYVVENR